jgi:peptidoglycan/xylan/chitin deacetylase (PgdA/CDA1 family)
MRSLKLALCGLAVCGVTAVNAADCPGNPDALGTSRTIVVDPSEHPRIGTMQYHETLPLEDHEVVLTFDDGPLPPRSTRLLEILASECVKATYFMVGRMARSFPDMVRRIHAAGHTIGTHSETHPLSFNKMSVERAETEINEGIASVTTALGDGSKPAPFFRIPGLLRADGVERYLASQHLMVWSADFLADDWTRIGPAQVYARALQRIEANHKGILLLHDIQERTVEALPGLLKELKRRGYRIVQVVPASPDMPKTATDPSQWVMHARMAWPQVPVYIETETELAAPSPASFGTAEPFRQRPLMHGPARSHALLARRQVPLPPVSVWPRSLDEPAAPPTPGRAALPAPSPQDFGYPGETPQALPEQRKAVPEQQKAVPEQRKASFDLVPETTGKETALHRILTEKDVSTEDAGTVTGSLPPPAPAQRTPVATTLMPRGAFP